MNIASVPIFKQKLEDKLQRIKEEQVPSTKLNQKLFKSLTAPKQKDFNMIDKIESFTQLALIDPLNKSEKYIE